MMKPKTNLSFVPDGELSHALMRLLNIDDFQLFMKVLEERCHGLALGAAQPEMNEQRAEICGRVQELEAIVTVVHGARNRVGATPVKSGKVW